MYKYRATAITGGLGKPSKMPGMSYGLPAAECRVGGLLKRISGSTCEFCYAERRNYLFPVVIEAQYRRFVSITHPQWVDAMVKLISTAPKKRRGFFRWHDSGDLQDLFHLIRVVEVCERTPNVMHWLPTREKGLVLSYLGQMGEFPKNLVVRLSAAMVDGEAPTVPHPLQTSGVHKHERAKGHPCPAKEKYANTCGPCRACWDKSISHVSYPWH